MFDKIRNTCALSALIASALTAPLTAQKPVWPQWMANPSHTGNSRVAGQGLKRILADIVYDPTVPQERSISGGSLLAHYQAPLTDGDRVFMEFKSGSYVSSIAYSQLSWGEKAFEWKNGKLIESWAFPSDWKAPGSLSDFWEPVFHAALANSAIYVPIAHGGIAKLNQNTGAVQQRIAPFGDDPNSYQTGPLTVDKDGNIYFNVVQVVDGTAFGGGFYSFDATDSFLVKVTPSGSVSKVSYKSLTIAEAPDAASFTCSFGFFGQGPWPPDPNAVPPAFLCGTQRVALNIAPGIAPDGTIYSITRTHFNYRYALLVAINPNLTKKWVSTLRERFHDGCGVPVGSGGVFPPNGAPGGCTVGAPLGVDPSTNGYGNGEVLDDSSSSPAVAPDGAVYYGAFSRYNYDQGHMMKFDAAGNFIKAYGFGWDQTPAFVHRKGGDAENCDNDNSTCYAVVIKENRYGNIGSYCDAPLACPPDRTGTNPDNPEGYFITQLDQALNVRWQFKSTNTQSCSRNPDGTIACVSDHPVGFEWCVNGHMVDRNGVVYANSEDGFLYAITANGLLKEKIFQQLALGAAYTPASMDGRGRIYSQNAGHLFVVGD